MNDELPAEMSAEDRNVFRLFQSSVLIPSKIKVYIPFSHDENNLFLAGVVSEGPDKFWYVEGHDEKFKASEFAIVALLTRVEHRRQKMFLDEFGHN